MAFFYNCIHQNSQKKQKKLQKKTNKPSLRLIIDHKMPKKCKKLFLFELVRKEEIRGFG